MIFIIGFMGTGKSAVSRSLSKNYGLTLVDSDEYIERREGKSIPDIFAESGEDGFRAIETDCLREISSKEYDIVSCGGGIVLRPENIEIMRANGKVVLLKASPETIFERVRHSDNRPVLNGNMNVEFIKKKLSEREPYYSVVNAFEIDTEGKTPDEIAREIGHFMNQKA